jgi:ABC-2 type transport system permease protein
VSLAWAFVATAFAYRLFLRRDFTDLAYDGSGRRVLVSGALPLAGLVALTAVLVTVATPAEGSGIEQTKLQHSLATVYAHLYRLQTRELHRPNVTEAQLQTTASCDKGGDRVPDEGPGNDWRCVVSFHLPGTAAVGTAIYQLDVTADGRYVADGDGPKEVNGYFPVRTSTGDAPNPLWQFDGNVDLLTSSAKE